MIESGLPIKSTTVYSLLNKIISQKYGPKSKLSCIAFTPLIGVFCFDLLGIFSGSFWRVVSMHVRSRGLKMHIVYAMERYVNAGQFFLFRRMLEGKYSLQWQYVLFLLFKCLLRLYVSKELELGICKWLTPNLITPDFTY